MLKKRALVGFAFIVCWLQSGHSAQEWLKIDQLCSGASSAPAAPPSPAPTQPANPPPANPPASLLAVHGGACKSVAQTVIRDGKYRLAVGLVDEKTVRYGFGKDGAIDWAPESVDLTEILGKQCKLMVDKPLHIFEDRNVLYINVRCTLDPNGMFKEDEGRLGFLRTHIYEDGQLHTPYGPVVWSNLEPQQQCIASRAFGAKNDAPWLVCRHVENNKVYSMNLFNMNETATINTDSPIGKRDRFEVAGSCITSHVAEHIPPPAPARTPFLAASTLDGSQIVTYAQVEGCRCPHIQQAANVPLPMSAICLPDGMKAKLEMPGKLTWQVGLYDNNYAVKFEEKKTADGKKIGTCNQMYRDPKHDCTIPLNPKRKVMIAIFITGIVEFFIVMCTLCGFAYCIFTRRRRHKKRREQAATMTVSKMTFASENDGDETGTGTASSTSGTGIGSFMATGLPCTGSTAKSTTALTGTKSTKSSATAKTGTKTSKRSAKTAVSKKSTHSKA